jgi:hypothetical protein
MDFTRFFATMFGIILAYLLNKALVRIAMAVMTIRRVVFVTSPLRPLHLQFVHNHNDSPIYGLSASTLQDNNELKWSIYRDSAQQKYTFPTAEQSSIRMVNWLIDDHQCQKYAKKNGSSPERAVYSELHPKRVSRCPLYFRKPRVRQPRFPRPTSPLTHILRDVYCPLGFILINYTSDIAMGANSALSTGLIAGGLALGLYAAHVYRTY